MSMIDEYRETLRGLLLLLERKKTLRKKERWNSSSYSDISRCIAVIEKEIREVQEVLYTLERRERDDGIVRYGYRKRVHGGVSDGVCSYNNFDVCSYNNFRKNGFEGSEEE